MKREYLILTVSTGFALAVAFLFFQLFFAPRLKDAPLDLQVVKLDRKIPAFFRGVLREEDLRETGLLVSDPILGVRGRPLLPAMHGFGPHDLLGFRNRAVLNNPAIIVLGDSQSYGNNALDWESWPKVLGRELGVEIYNASVGGWSPLHYVEIMRSLAPLKPQAFIIAIYTGNDSLESFRLAYTVDYWRDFRVDSALSADNLSELKNDDETVLLSVQFSADVREVAFTPARRWIANDPQSAIVQAGYDIIQRSIQECQRTAAAWGAALEVVIIPTKEYVFRDLVQAPDGLYADLLKAERGWIDLLLTKFAALDVKVSVADLSPLLKEDPSLYPLDRDGHPLSAGYAALAGLIAEKIAPRVGPLSEGFYKVHVSEREEWWFVLRDKSLKKFVSRDAAMAHGYNPESAVAIDLARLEEYELVGLISEAESMSAAK